MRQPFAFTGTGQTFAPIWLKNVLLRILTLNFYYPWARANTLRYQYAHTEFGGSPFEFLGTGRQFFRGYIITFGVLGVLGGIAFLTATSLVGLMPDTVANKDSLQWAIASYLLVLFLLPLIPLAVHGTLRYRLANSAWRGIRLGYDGALWALYKKYILYFLVVMGTAGLGAAWAQVWLRQYAFGHMKLGQARAGFAGTGSKLFRIYLVVIGLVLVFALSLTGFVVVMAMHSPYDGKGNVLEVIWPALAVFYALLAVASVWTAWRLILFQFNNLYLRLEDQVCFMQTSITFGQALSLTLGLPLLQALTLGLATPWTSTAQARILIGSLSLPEDFPLNRLGQVNPAYTSAMGEDLAQVLDVDFGL